MDSERLNSLGAPLFMFKEALLATVRSTFSGRIPASKLFRLLRAELSPEVGTARVSIRDAGDVVERKWSMGELEAELPAVDGRPLFEDARFMEGEDGRPMNIPECRFDNGTEGRSTGDPRSCEDGGVAAACSC